MREERRDMKLKHYVPQGIQRNINNIIYTIQHFYKTLCVVLLPATFHNAFLCVPFTSPMFFHNAESFVFSDVKSILLRLLVDVLCRRTPLHTTGISYQYHTLQYEFNE
uniref:Uncharacterized protein n=1 Tax=Trichobilharzia regenti TaxID=157069 RepID=A0AA85JF48_TRIRE|nr:unnamed protein product [Trichobilharzia regenti]